MHNCQNEVCDESGFSLRPLPLLFQLLYITVSSLARENTRHIVVSSWNDIWEMSAEIPYWWGVTTQIWVVLLIGWSKFLTNKKLFPDLASMHHQSGISAPVLQTLFCRKTTSGFVKCWSFSQAIYYLTHFINPGLHNEPGLPQVWWLCSIR